MMCIRYGKSIIPTASEIEDILNAHNTYRASVNPPSNAMLRLVWYPDGASKADVLANKCKFDHDTNGARATSKYPGGGGQNLYMTTGKRIESWNVIIKAWHDEVQQFSYGVDQDNFHDVGHYTQVVWGNTKEIGCARSMCPGQQIYVCNYYPPGNYPPYYIPYQQSQKQSCSGCLQRGSCVSAGPFTGKLLDTCDLFCTDQYENCPTLKKFCPYLMNDCALSCQPKCKN